MTGPSRVFFVAAALLVLLPAPTIVARPKADDTLGPPAGIIASAASLKDVIALYNAANVRSGANVVVDATVESNGLSGSAHYVSDHDDFRWSLQLGPFASAGGRSQGQRWELNENGLSRLVNDVGRRDDIAAEFVQDALVETPGLKLLGETHEPAAFVLESAPPGGRREWLFVDHRTGLLDRVESIAQGGRIVETLDDYATTDGGTISRHVHISGPNPGQDSDARVAHDDRPATLDPSQLAIPSNVRAFDEFPPDASQVDIPAKFFDGKIAVRVNIEGRGIDFMLDSGASGIVIDSGVVGALNLPTYGKFHEPSGSSVATLTIVPEIRVGRLRLSNVVAAMGPFNVPTLNYEARQQGILGYDFIAGAVIHVDYFNHKVEAIRKEDFHPEEVANAAEIPVVLDDGVPLSRLWIGSTASERFIIDTGANDVTVFSAFARANPDDVRDQGKGNDVQWFFRYIALFTTSGMYRVAPTQLKSLIFGPTRFGEVMAMEPEHAERFEGDYDGLIGYQVLQFYDVYFDYADRRVIVAPNATLLRRARKPAA